MSPAHDYRWYQEIPHHLLANLPTVRAQTGLTVRRVQLGAAVCCSRTREVSLRARESFGV